MERTLLGAVSVMLNRLLGGPSGWSLCASWALGRGPDCLPCRLVAWALGEPGHCRDELARTLACEEPGSPAHSPHEQEPGHP